ncbi:hypothetical protein PsYK624_070350 [Phanerochaete sordida]|uniref:Uncharacterized protein n=1 Tax=Phanerochaete sordida TaxID=48140 RepID=A0A9P3GBN1_9APHY|nr:hypothetical protein PsYK624_070350 [Phanerochaete sordida]
MAIQPMSIEEHRKLEEKRLADVEDARKLAPRGRRVAEGAFIARRRPRRYRHADHSRRVKGGRLQNGPAPRDRRPRARVAP